MEKKTEVSQQFLKSYTNKFDAETIFILNLPNRSIASLGSIGDCINLIYLDVSQNQIKDISNLANCKQLQFLKLGKNSISDVSALSNLAGLIHLDLYGNQLKTVKSLAPLKDIKTLNSLVLKSPDEKFVNPCCEETNYRESVFGLLSQLNRLDGVNKKQKPLTDSKIPEQKKINFVLNIPTQYWYTKEYPKLEGKTSIQLDEGTLKNNMDTCKNMIRDVELKFKSLGINL